LILLARNHTAWLLAQLQTIPILSNQVFVTKAVYPAPNQATRVVVPYAVIHPADGIDEQARHSGPNTIINPRFTIHAVGLTADHSRAIAEKIKAVLVVAGFGIIPTISGERPRRLWYHSPLPIQVDSDITPEVFFHVAEVGFASELIQ
jgi:hypothetical protein